MELFADPPEQADARSQLRRLIRLRWLVLAVMAMLVLLAPAILDIPLPQWPMFCILGIAAGLNLFAQQRLVRDGTATSGEVFSQLLLDIATLGALIFFSGGATNPLVSLLLPPVAIAALSLPGRQVMVISGFAIAVYSLLMVIYLPLNLADASRGTHLHLTGMWLSFAVSTGMIAWFIVRMTRLIRQRDAELALAREHALRDERVMAMGTLAAGAAHELGTPLATMTLLAGELATDPTLSASSRDDIAVLNRQIGVCKEIITRLARRAGAERLEDTTRECLTDWLDRLLDAWHASRPRTASRILHPAHGITPTIVPDPRLEQALLNLLNNAANASQQTVDIALNWTRQIIRIEIRDQGPGFPPKVLATNGQHSLPPHARGTGLGLLLTRSAIEQLGGSLLLGNLPDGGAFARVDLPRGGE